jgi:hypothetical protein
MTRLRPRREIGFTRRGDGHEERGPFGRQAANEQLTRRLVEKLGQRPTGGLDIFDSSPEADFLARRDPGVKVAHSCCRGSRRLDHDRRKRGRKPLGNTLPVVRAEMRRDSLQRLFERCFGARAVANPTAPHHVLYQRVPIDMHERRFNLGAARAIPVPGARLEILATHGVLCMMRSAGQSPLRPRAQRGIEVTRPAPRAEPSRRGPGRSRLDRWSLLRVSPHFLHPAAGAGGAREGFARIASRATFEVVMERALEGTPLA